MADIPAGVFAAIPEMIRKSELHGIVPSIALLNRPWIGPNE
jgi:hypothetical protein